MSCDELRERLSDYLDGDLGEAQRRRVEAHLGRCEACRDELAEIESLVRQARSLGGPVEPERDLWPGISGRIAEPVAGRGAWWYVSRAGLVAAALLVAVVLVERSGRESERTAGGPLGEAPSVDRPAQLDARAAQAARLRGGLMHVHEDLLRVVEERRAELDPETVAAVDRNVAIIDRAIAEIYRALEQDPDNGQLERMLAATYQREVELLKQIHLL